MNAASPRRNPPDPPNRSGDDRPTLPPRCAAGSRPYLERGRRACKIAGPAASDLGEWGRGSGRRGPSRQQPTARTGTTHLMSHVLVRFPYGEMLEGEAPDRDLDRDNFELLVAGDGRAVIPLPAVKCLTLHRRPIDPPARGDLGKIALHFRDGDVLTGLLAEAPRRSRFGV